LSWRVDGVTLRFEGKLGVVAQALLAVFVGVAGFLTRRAMLHSFGFGPLVAWVFLMLLFLVVCLGSDESG
jgi:hypothetical protein